MADAVVLQVVTLRRQLICTSAYFRTSAYYCCPVKHKYANGLKHQTLPLMGATRPASEKCNIHTLTKGLQTALITWLFVSFCLNSRRETRRPPLEVAFGA